MRTEHDDGELEQRARAGDVPSLLALGARFSVRENVNGARACFAQAAKLGSVEGLRRLAKHLLSHEPVNGADGVAMMRDAAERGDAEASHLCAVLAAQDRDLPQRWAVAQQLSVEAGARDYPLGCDEQAFLAASSLSLEAIAAPVAFELVRPAPRIAIFAKFATPDLCDWLITRAKPHLQRARVYDKISDGGREESARNNSAATFDVVQSDIIMMALRERVKVSSQLSNAQLEPLSILHYAPGERFEPHFDFLDSTEPAHARDIARGGQRVATFLLYLNDDFEGGETAFPHIDYRFKGAKGDAILFWNVDEKGNPDRRTRHAGVPPTRGEKWLYSQWIREAKA